MILCCIAILTAIHYNTISGNVTQHNGNMTKCVAASTYINQKDKPDRHQVKSRPAACTRLSFPAGSSFGAAGFGAACRYVFHEMENGNHKQSTTIAPENCNRSDRVTMKSFALPTP